MCGGVELASVPYIWSFDAELLRSPPEEGTTKSIRELSKYQPLSPSYTASFTDPKKLY